jgi:hypothetical protein
MLEVSTSASAPPLKFPTSSASGTNATAVQLVAGQVSGSFEDPGESAARTPTNVSGGSFQQKTKEPRDMRMRLRA